MNFIDLNKQYSIIKDKIDSGISNVLSHGRYINGPEIIELEKKLAEFADTNHCVACSSGTDALLMPLLAWDIKPDDAVFTSPFTFIATAEVIELAGAHCVFADVKQDTFNIDPERLDEAISKVKAEGKYNPKLIIPVDIFGLPAEYEEIEKIAQKHGLLILEDAAQSFGASINNKRTCSFGNAAATSFFPAKPLGCYGDGGAVFTDDVDLYQKLISVRNHGAGDEPYKHDRIGINGRLDSIQAAVLLAKLSIFQDEIEKRNSVAKKYAEKLSDKFQLQEIPNGYSSVFAQYCFLTDSSAHRKNIQGSLKKADIPSAIYYPVCLHLQPAYNHLGYKKGDMPISEKLSDSIMAVPMHPYLSDEEIDKICEIILKNTQ